jgi:hypothetical protein
MNKLAILALAMLGACTTVHDDPSMPGSAHTATVVLNDAPPPPTVDAMVRRMDEEVMEAATKRCATEGGNVVVLRRVQPGINIMQLTYRCER